ncbi:uncharacterized protein Bfra_012428 [Botrytis fragariae]|uniref:Uncharacterized protein n=1 Tax=Botrytis fragariae TaxID=1964551 RepID=A0A8H6EDU5_9HELO|nr:uncharacterized protein Bfra_012428 [Botrytis fragariae]KAF5868516.1 hypothetical protein Bfra_012428 [Botrytis fragariae]
MIPRESIEWKHLNLITTTDLHFCTAEEAKPSSPGRKIDQESQFVSKALINLMQNRWREKLLTASLLEPPCRIVKKGQPFKINFVMEKLIALVDARSVSDITHRIRYSFGENDDREETLQSRRE